MPIARAVRMIRQAISPRLAIRRLWIIALHPEHAERWAFGDGGVEAGGEAEPQHVAGLDGIDDAVVPQVRGGVPWAAFVLIFLADRSLECLGLLRRPFLRVAVNGGQHGSRLLAAHHRDAAVGPREQ